MLRPDEEFVLVALSNHYGCSFVPGDDPPDAYLNLHGRTIAVEVTRLIEEVVDEKGHNRSRYADDLPGLDLIDELDEWLGPEVPDGKYVFLILTTPINDVRRTRRELAAGILDVLEREKDERKMMVGRCKASIHVYEGNRSSGKKIIGALDNQDASPDIAYNVARILSARIEAKETKRRRVTADEYWLALLAEYWIADGHSYQRAYSALNPVHGFDSVILVGLDQSVHVLSKGR